MSEHTQFPQRHTQTWGLCTFVHTVLCFQSNFLLPNVKNQRKPPSSLSQEVSALRPPLFQVPSPSGVNVLLYFSVTILSPRVLGRLPNTHLCVPSTQDGAMGALQIASSKCCLRNGEGIACRGREVVRQGRERREPLRTLSLSSNSVMDRWPHPSAHWPSVSSSSHPKSPPLGPAFRFTSVLGGGPWASPV